MASDLDIICFANYADYKPGSSSDVLDRDKAIFNCDPNNYLSTGPIQ